jgi:SAM-dependent methyltransferase
VFDASRWVAWLWPIAIVLAIGTVALLFVRAPNDLPPIRPIRQQAAQPTASPVASFQVSIPFEDAKPILDALREKLPTDLKGKTPAEIESAWPGWVARHNAEIRARLERGDEDSIVNFWLYGTTFTTLPRVTQQGIAKLGDRSRADDILLGRLNDLIEGIASPGANERLRFARQVIERHRIDPTLTAGKEQAKVYLVGARERMVAENRRYSVTAQSASRIADRSVKLAAYATLYADRGLSSDTSLSADFALDHAFEAIKSQGKLVAGSVRRVAIVGPGLDFTDKAEGYDFYPQQTIQPFAVLDSLIRLGLAKPDDLHMTTFDVSPRVNQHLEAAVQRARRGDPCVLQLPLTKDDASRHSRQWNPDLVKYWQRFGGAIGDETEAMAPPSSAGDVRVRAVRVRPEIVRSIVPRDVNIVLERLEAPRADDRFDVIVATNVLVYYDAFEQALALANVSKMLRPGGFFLTNYAVAPSAPIESTASFMTTVDFDRQHNGDTLFGYRRR